MCTDAFMDDVNKTIPQGPSGAEIAWGSPLSGGPEGGTGIPPRRGVHTPVDCYLFGTWNENAAGRCLIFSIEIIISLSRDSFFWTQNQIPKL